MTIENLTEEILDLLDNNLSFELWEIMREYRFEIPPTEVMKIVIKEFNNYFSDYGEKVEEEFRQEDEE